MRTIAVSLLKGGVGKTFLATHLAWYLDEAAGRRVVFVDLDPQARAVFDRIESQGDSPGA